MILFLTGVPGSGKTLRMMWWLQQKEYQQRPTYSNIDGAGHQPLPNPWYSAPEGSVIVVDEAQFLWPARSHTKAVPDQVSRMDTHRHGGYDFIIATQRPTGVDHHIRGLVTKHEHLRRKAGIEAAVIHRKDEVFDPKDRRDLQTADQETWRFPKELYGSYSSAVMHTAKIRVPSKAKMFGVVLALLATVVVWRGTAAYHSFVESSPEIEVQSESKPDKTRDIFGLGDQLQVGFDDGQRRVIYEPDDGITGCVLTATTCYCIQYGSNQMARNYSRCRNWMARQAPGFQ